MENGNYFSTTIFYRVLTNHVEFWEFNFEFKVKVQIIMFSLCREKVKNCISGEIKLGLGLLPLHATSIILILFSGDIIPKSQQMFQE